MQSSEGWVGLVVGLVAVVGSVVGFRHAESLARFFTYSDRQRPRDPDDRRDLMRLLTVCLGLIGIGFVIASLINLL
jgi:hypothetical protein